MGADLGTTQDSLKTMRHMKEALNAHEFDAVLFPGDLSYADGFPQRWDDYAKLGEFLWETVPTAYVAGNHEFTSENYVNYLPRYGWPSSDRSGSPSPLWFSFDAGLAHVVMLCSYCNSGKESLQYQWLEQDLVGVDRSKTPWVVGAWHAPWYTSNHGHSMKETKEMREHMEELIHQHGVDIVFSGHVHAYERTGAIHRNETACDGTYYITIGDGGNKEGPYCPWEADYEWSLRKENSFGWGLFDIVNATHAQWMWHRNQDGERVSADHVWIPNIDSRDCDRVIV